MAQTVKNPAVTVTNKEILAEVNLISQIQQIETRLAVQPKSLRFAQLADAYVSMGQYDDGIQICVEGLKNFPDYVTASLVLARAYYLSGNKTKAKEVLEGFLQVRPSHIAARKMLGDISLENDDIKAAVTHYRIALRLDPINRQIIQTLVDLKDKYQKIKDAGTGEDEDEDAIRPRDRAVGVQTVAPEPVVSRLSGTQEFRMPVTKKDLTEEMEQVEDSIVASLMSDSGRAREIPKEVPSTSELIEPRPVETATVKPADLKIEETLSTFTGVPEAVPVTDKTLLTPAFTDASGVQYFYADEELSFAQFKQRNELQRVGKAVVMDRGELDRLIAKSSGQPAATTAEKPAIRVEEQPTPIKTKPVVTFDEEFEIADIRKTHETTVPTSVVAEEKFVDEEPLTKEEQEVILADVEVSYRDYLDLITDEEELLEALFQEDHEAGLEEELTSPLVAEVAGAGTAPSATEDDDEIVLSYDEYLDELDDDELVAEAMLEEEVLLSLADFSAYLDRSDERIDLATYALVSGSDGELLRLLDEGPEPLLSYRGYLSEPLTETSRTDALFDQPAPSSSTGTADTLVTGEAAIPSPLSETKTPEPVALRTEPKPAVQTAEMVEEDEEVEIVDEEDIDPADVSMDLVEQFAARGQFGAAYKVCRMMKLSNPTDAKIDRKILELKRLYVWSTQMVG